MAGRYIILSLDAVGNCDLPYLESLPNFKAFLRRAAVCPNVYSVYPSLTYPAHTSIVTGRKPGNHGIVNNLRIQPGRDKPDWYWQRRFIRGTTLYDEAYKIGMKTAALLWPVTGRAKINYNLPEVLPNRPWQNQIGVSLCNGSPFYEFDLQRRFGSLRDGIKQPQLDDFVHASLLHTLEVYKPDLTLVHFTDVDTNRHLHGVQGAEVYRALARHDRRLGELTGLLKKMGWYEDTDIAIMGDHFQMDVSQAVNLNRLFLKHGYLTVKHGRITAWRALAWESDGSCSIYLKKGQPLMPVRKLLEEFAERENSGIESIFSSKKAKELGADPRCCLMVEASPGFYFQNGWKILYEKTPGMSAVHGYLPAKQNYQTFFMAAGPHFRAGAIESNMTLMDEGVTLAKVMGLDLGNVDGRVAISLLF